MQINNQTILSFRGKKNPVDACTPYHFLHEKERQHHGRVERVNTIFLTNNECPYKCLMCDLWKNTLDHPTPAGAIPLQIEKALSCLPDATVIKLYNSGNFFDGKAIPTGDYKDIAGLLAGYKHVIVENHPRMIGPRIADFQALLNGSLEIAMGIETLHPGVLQKLNKHFSLKDVKKAALFLNSLNIKMRAFLLLNPPFLTGRKQNREWVLKSQKILFDLGFSACTIIPTRAGNGMMEKLMENGHYVPPEIPELEYIFETSLSKKRGRVFVDCWDLQLFSSCGHCINARIRRLERMNLSQKIEQPVECTCNSRLLN